MIGDLQRWLALEHEAVWLYGLIGGRFDVLRDQSKDSWDDHRAARDHLTELVRSGGHQPVGPAMSYGPPIRTVKGARAAARDIEQRIAETCVAVAAARPPRRFAVSRLRAGARAATIWGAQPEAFPGLR
jgi:hypothetical protein